MADQDEYAVPRDLADLAMEPDPEAMAAAFASLMNQSCGPKACFDPVISQPEGPAT